MINNREALVWLNCLNFTNRQILKLNDYFTDISRIFYVNRFEIESANILSAKNIDYLLNSRNEEILKKIFKDYENFGAKIITIIDEDYPERLRLIDDPPAVLYVKGEILPEDELSFSVVGSRKVTQYGSESCKFIVKELVQNNITIVSGMANGIDTIAHETALDNGGRTIAVLGTGLNVIYPKRNEKLYNRICENGAVISEFPANTKGAPYNFPRRNRIVSGLGLGVLVVEAKEKSGSLITAGLAGEQGKDVFAIPGNIGSIYSRGTNKLIQDGAKLVMSADDILNEIREFKHLTNKTEQDSLKIDKSNYSADERAIIEVLESGEFSIDQIINKTGLNIKEAQTVITKLELLDLIVSTAAGKYVLKL